MVAYEARASNNSVNVSTPQSIHEPSISILGPTDDEKIDCAIKYVVARSDRYHFCSRHNVQLRVGIKENSTLLCTKTSNLLKFIIKLQIVWLGFATNIHLGL
jgi:hypothetical protein